jgi:predicted nucleotidyltransferase component of viral defense system
MHEAIRIMLDRYSCKTRDDYVNALREILQELALLGLWRSKFFEHAAFYGDTALRVLYGLDRYSEDLDFSLLKPHVDFTLSPFGEALRREITSFGFQVEFQRREKSKHSAIESAFLKANTYQQLIVVETEETLLRDLHPQKTLRIRLEVDTDPPPGFHVESRYILQPIPFSVRAFRPPDLFAGKLHAILCRKWKSRVKGRDWYDLVWYAGRYPEVSLKHLESRMRQTGDWQRNERLSPEGLQKLLNSSVEELDIVKARTEVEPFVRNPVSLDMWSYDFFKEVISRIRPV